MEKSWLYDGELEREDILEIYGKTIANLGIFNVIFPKSFDYASADFRGNLHNFYVGGFTDPLLSNIGRKVMESVGLPQGCIMERYYPGDFYPFLGPSRKISLHNVHDGIEAKVEGSRRTLDEVKKVMDRVFTRTFSSVERQIVAALVRPSAK